MVTGLNSSGIPVYLQVRDRISALIIDGDVSVGELLPSVRTVAAELKVNPMTVHKGFQLLVELGIIESDAGRGMLVLPKARERLLQIERERFVEQQWPEVIATVYRLGLDVDALVTDLIREGKR